MPNARNAELEYAKKCNDNERPGCKESRTRTKVPIYEKLLMDKNMLEWAKSSTKNDASSHDLPNDGNAALKRVSVCNDSGLPE